MSVYDSINELPAEIKEKFPARACELYRATFNRVSDKLAMAQPENEKRDVAELIAEKAHDAAMLTVRTEFERQEDGTWTHEPIDIEIPKVEDPVGDDG